MEQIKKSQECQAWFDAQVEEFKNVGFDDDQIDLSEQYTEIEAMKRAEEQLAVIRDEIAASYHFLKYHQLYTIIWVGKKFIRIRREWSPHPSPHGSTMWWVWEGSDALAGQVFESLEDLKKAIDAL